MVDGEENVSHLEIIDFEVAGAVLVAIRFGIDVCREVLDGCTVDDTANAEDFNVVEEAFAVEPFAEGEGDVDGVDCYVELGVVAVVFGIGGGDFFRSLCHCCAGGCCCCGRGGAFADGPLLLVLVSRTSGDEDVVECDDAASPCWHDGAFKHDFYTTGLGQVIANPASKSLLREDGVDGPYRQADKCCRAYNDPHDVSEEYPGYEGADLVERIRSERANGHPFETYSKSLPEACRSCQ